jgi:hypothetical protein
MVLAGQKMRTSFAVARTIKLHILHLHTIFSLKEISTVHKLHAILTQHANFYISLTQTFLDFQVLLRQTAKL